MKTMRKWLSCIILAAMLFVFGTPHYITYAQEAELSEEQKNVIAMLNYITILTQEINEFNLSEIYLEGTYSFLTSNINLDNVDSRTLRQITDIQSLLKKCILNYTQHERIQYTYKHNKEQSIWHSLANSNLSSVTADIGSLVATPIGLIAELMVYNDDTEQNYLNDGWTLDDQVKEEFLECRSRTFLYVAEMTKEYNLPRELVLTENAARDFVSWKKNDNVTSRIKFWETNKKTYQFCGEYWLNLAESYYINGDYQKCIDAVEMYENMGVHIFSRDSELARIISLAIVAAKETYDANEYVSYASEKAQIIVDNTNNDDWTLRYFAAQTYLDIYVETRNEQYLMNAYQIVDNNVNGLYREQQKFNDAYLNAVVEMPIKKGEEAIKRKTELPPIYEPLKLNCDLLFMLAEKINLSDAEKAVIDKILHPNDERLFLIPSIDDKYWFSNPYKKIEAADIDIGFIGAGLSLPAEYLTEDAEIEVTVSEPGKSWEAIFTDWKIEKVERGEENNLSTFIAYYTSTSAQQYDWTPNAMIEIRISPNRYEAAKYYFRFEVTKAQNEWYEYFTPWAGYKNNWYDYLVVWEAGVKFERIE